MKALSLWQPWASAIPAGLKRIETRSWPTKHRGRLAIASTRSIPKEFHRTAEVLFNSNSNAFARCGICSPDALPLGCVVATCDVVDCVLMTPEFIAGIEPLEREWGLYEPGRWAWMLAAVAPFSYPVPIARGGQRVWNWNEEAA